MGEPKDTFSKIELFLLRLTLLIILIFGLIIVIVLAYKHLVDVITSS